MEVNAIVLAAGKGTRMKSDMPKCAELIIDKSMVEYVVDALEGIQVKDIVTVVGYKQEIIRDILKERTRYAYQEQQLGTAHAVSVTKEVLASKEGETIIAIGDMPFITEFTYFNLLQKHVNEKADLTILTTIHPQPHGYGRIVRDQYGNVLEIVEEKDATKEQSEINEINAAVYVVNNQKLFHHLSEIQSTNSQKEYYLTDLVKIFVANNYKIASHIVQDFNEISGVNDKNQLCDMQKKLQKEIITKHLLAGVTIDLPSSVEIGVNVVLEPGVVVRPGSIILGNSIVRQNTIIGPNSEIKHATIGRNSIIRHSVVEYSTLEDGSIVGPYKYVFKNDYQN